MVPSHPEAGVAEMITGIPTAASVILELRIVPPSRSVGPDLKPEIVTNARAKTTFMFSLNLMFQFLSYWMLAATPIINLASHKIYISVFEAIAILPMKFVEKHEELIHFNRRFIETSNLLRVYTS